MGEGEPISGATRQLSSSLLLGMLTMPTLFVWLFLRRGYASSLRRAAFSYTGILFAVGLIGGLGGR
jgi:hypothetical protein